MAMAVLVLVGCSNLSEAWWQGACISLAISCLRALVLSRGQILVSSLL